MTVDLVEVAVGVDEVVRPVAIVRAILVFPVSIKASAIHTTIVNKYMIPERGPQTVVKQFLSCAINVLQAI